jgi:hypothetical protein
MGETHRPYSRLRRAQNTISILACNQVGRHRVYSGHYPRIFVAPKNAPNAETKRQSGAVPILLLVIPALTTSAYSSLNVSQKLNPQPQLLTALVYHSATSFCSCVKQSYKNAVHFAFFLVNSIVSDAVATPLRSCKVAPQTVTPDTNFV